MSILRVGVVGFGMMGRNHVRVLQSIEGCELVGIAEPQANKPSTHQGVPFLPDVEALLELGIDACVVAAPTEEHESIGLILANAGVHTLMEKPLAADLAAANRLHAAFDTAGLVGAVGHIERFNPAVREARHRLDDELLGEVFQVATRRQGPSPYRIRDVGVVMDLATHDLDLTMWVTGSDYASISARFAHKSGSVHEDLVAATGALTGGVVTNHLVNWLTPTKERVTWITGEKGCLLIDTLSADLTYFANGAIPTEWEAMSRFRGVSEGDVIRFAIAKPEPLVVELTAFLDAVRGDSRGIVTFEQGLAVVRIARAVAESAHHGTTIDLNTEQVDS